MKLQITVPDFVWTLPNDDRIIPGGEDLFPILGFLGRWNKPTHLIIGFGEFRWIFPRSDFNERLQSCTDPGRDINDQYKKDPGCFSVFDLEDEVYSVWFEYIGDDEEFIAAIRASWTERVNKKVG